MSSITTRAGKGLPLSHAEMDANLNNLNADKLEASAIAGFITATSTDTLTNKSINLSSNPITGTLAQFNAAVSDANLVSISGTEVLSNKTLPEATNTIEFVPAGTGSVPTTAQEKLRECVSLFDYMTTAEKLNVSTRLGTLDVTASILAAIAANPGRRIFAPAGRYVHSATIELTVDGTWLSGESNGGYEFGPDTGVSASNYGTVFEWGGSAGGTQMLYGPTASPTTARTIGGGGIENIRLIGLGANAIGTNAVATGLRMADVSNSEFRNIKISGSTSVQLDLTGYVPDHSYLNSVYGCTFDNFKLIAGGSAKGMYSGPTANAGGGDHPAFCRFSNFHITHENGIALHIDEMDDCEFNTFATSRLGGGTGDAIVLEGKGEAIHFRCVNAGYTITGVEAASKIWVKTGNRAIYFEMAGIDDNVRPTIDAGAEAFYMYLGSNNVAFDSEFRSPVISLPNIVKGEATYLDWYEEGTFTPTVIFGGASVGVTYGAQLGRYVRIGRTVFITCSFTLTAKGSSVGTAQIAGLPWVSSSNNSSVGQVRPVGGFVGASVDRGIALTVPNSVVVATFFKNVSGSGGMVVMTDSDFGATSQIQATFNYEV